uniref:Snf7 family protein n=1 Tax=Candidatus Methanomethylicus mesodigestus TaxID=1867258 RepID=A0A7C3F119_9CREN
MSNFVNRWEKKDTPGISTRVKESVRPPGPLKPRLEQAVRSIQLQMQKLDIANQRFLERDRMMFSKVVDAYSKHDMDHAKIYANELAEIRKMSKMMIQARMALEQIVMRLSTVTELGDIVVTLAPAMGVIKNVKAGISQLLPEAERELGDISTMLSGILVDAGQSGGLSLNFESANEDAQKILGEAAVVAEQRVKEKFPELPAGVSAGEKTGF